MECNDMDYITFTNVLKMHSSLLNSKVSKNIRDQGKTLFCWAFATSTMLRQSLNLFISKLDEKSSIITDAVKKLNEVKGMKGLGRYFKQVIFMSLHFVILC